MTRVIFEPRTLVVLDHKKQEMKTFTSSEWEGVDYADAEDFLVKTGYNLGDVQWMITDSYYSYNG